MKQLSSILVEKEQDNFKKLELKEKGKKEYWKSLILFISIILGMILVSYCSRSRGVSID
jgi:hypothetical protein